MLSAQTAEQADFWRWVPHPEVWLLVGGLIGLYAYAVRVIGPKAVPAGRPAVTRRQIGFLVAGTLLLWVASDWPVHDIGEQYLYLVHMCQHLALDAGDAAADAARHPRVAGAARRRQGPRSTDGCTSWPARSPPAFCSTAWCS